ncbi:MAG: PAS domain-containing protein, partial [Cytophagaceae bacterium]
MNQSSLQSSKDFVIWVIENKDDKDPLGNYLASLKENYRCYNILSSKVNFQVFSSLLQNYVDRDLNKASEKTASLLFEFFNKIQAPSEEMLSCLHEIQKCLTCFLDDFSENLSTYKIINSELQEYFNCISKQLVIITVSEKKEDFNHEAYFHLFDDFPSLIRRSGVDGKCTYFNNFWLRFTGRSMEEEQGDGWVTGVHPDDVDRCIRTYIDSFNERKAFEMDYRLKRHDGEYRWIKDFGRPFYDNTGRFEGYLGSCYDITDNILNIEDLDKKNKVLEGILENLPAIIMEADEGGNIERMAGKGLKKLELRENQKVNTNLSEFVKGYEHHLVSVKEGKSVSFVSKTDINQKSVWFQNYFFPHGHRNAKSIGLLFDITDQKMAEEELLNKNRILDGIMTNIPVIVCRINSTGQLLESTGTGLKQLGLKENEMVGAEIAQAFPEANEYIGKVLNYELNCFETEITFNGNNRHYQCYFFPEGDEGHFVGFNLDITDRVRIKEELEESRFFIQRIADSNPNLIIVYDIINQRNVYTNKVMQELLGMDDVAIQNTGKDLLYKVIHPEDLPKVYYRQERFRQISENEVLDLEYRVKNFRGEWRWLHTRGVIFKKTEDREVWQVLITAQDVTEHKEAEESIRQLNESLKHTIEGIALLDLAGTFTSVNKSFANVFQYYTEDLIGMDWRSIIYQDDLLIAEKALRELDNHSKTSFEIRGFRKDGTIAFIDITMVANISRHGKCIGYYSFIRDITERKKAEESIRHNEALLAEAQNIAHLGSWEWDLKTNNFFLSNELFRILGYDEVIQDFSFQDFLSHIAEEDRSVFENTFKSSVERKESFACEYKIVTQKGESRNLLTRGRVILDQHEQVVRMAGTGLDITEIKETENKLRKSESLLIEAQELARLGNWEIDLSTRKVYWSQEMYTLFGFKPNEFEVSYDFFLKILSNEARKTMLDVEKKILRTFKPSNFEHNILLSNGKERIVYGQAKPIFDASGRIIRISGYSQDITERKESEMMLKTAYEELKVAEEQLIKLNIDLEKKVGERTQELIMKNDELLNNNLELKKINTDLDNFIYTASHDLKAPISNIEGLVYALKGEVGHIENAELDILFEMINDSINRFKDTIRDLTEISKVQKNIYEDNGTININSILDEVRSDIKELIQVSDARIVAEISIAEIRFSRKNLRSLFYNFLSNSIKYASPDRHPEILIRVVPAEDNYLMLSVKDNGLGFQSSG